MTNQKCFIKLDDENEKLLLNLVSGASFLALRKKLRHLQNVKLINM